MTDAGQCPVSPEAVRSAVGNVGGIVMRTVNMVLELESMLVAPMAFATIGAAVASANTRMQDQQVATMRSLLTLLQQINSLVRTSVDAHDTADQAIATGLWSSPAGAAVASQTVGAGAGVSGQPGSVTTVVGYLNAAGLGDDANVPMSDPNAFVSWLEANPQHQAGLGVIGVYSGTARGFGDVPGGVRGGDVVAIDPGATGEVTQLGVIGESGSLHNNGLVQPDFGDVATLRVYRPM